MEEKQRELRGLTSQEVQERKEKGLINTASTVKTKSVKRIFYDNICTVFNIINVILFIALLCVGSYKNLLFMLVIAANTIIGIVQELRSKKSVDTLTILTESKLDVLRDGKTVQLYKSCKANESLLTGESNLIEKQVGDELLSGSFIAAGSCYCRVNRVGADSYAAKINNEAKYIKKNNSQILKSFKFIISICSIIIFPVGAALFSSSYFVHDRGFQASVVTTVGALVGMIPAGMILLTSSVLAVSVIRLSRKKVLVNEMYCIETLARVDVLCLDKTGTLTADCMNVHEVINLNTNDDKIMTALASIVAASDESNATSEAVGDYVQGVQPVACKQFVPFSSETKWSGGAFANGKTYIMGAAEFVFSDKEKYPEIYEKINQITETVRILVLGSSDLPVDANAIPEDLHPMALILIKDKLRDNVCETVDYFKEQGVTLKVISGDSVKTVRNIALDTGIEGADQAVDMTTVKTDEELEEVAERCNVFGRVTPAQKKKLVLALKKNGHKVAMTGDGVNDVLALKEADCSVSMASGSEAARNVSQLVLVNNDFAAMPHVVAEGRRTINNIERSSSLYLVKTMYSIALAVFFMFSPLSYPFQPIQLSLISTMTVALPSFVLALQPNKNIVRGNFTYNIISRAAPAAICVILSIITTALLSGVLGISQEQLSTMAVTITSFVCLLLIVRLSIPFNALRAAMMAVSVTGVVIAFSFFHNFFSLVPLEFPSLMLLLGLCAVSAVVFNLLYNVADHFIEESKRLSAVFRKK